MRIIKGIFTGYLILNVILSCLLYPLIYLDFNFRKEYIQEVLCIKKDEPITVCGGSCYLDKQLAKAAGKQKQEQQINEKHELNTFSNKHVTISFNYSIEDYNPTFRVYNSSIHLDRYLQEIFHPPRLV